MKKFEDFGLSKTLEKSILNMGFVNPTAVQEQSIPFALEGRDILGSAQTGTGKTGAFSIPLIQKLMRDEIATALVLTPTRELAKQVLGVIEGLLFGQNAINVACLIGGEQITKQLKQLKRKPRIIVGTPGRINDHLERRSLRLNNVKFLVLDETDRMLDMGFGVQIDRILKHIPESRQTLMFSATIPDQIARLSTKYLTKPERISIGRTNTVAANIDNEIIKIKKEDKYQLLLEQLEKREGTILIFVKTKHGTVKMAKNLSHDHFTSEPLNGNLRQSKRDTVMKKFREKKFRIMVATDIASRGLDVPHIEHVINYDLPQLAEDYIHRLGRTGRANASGSALTFVSTKELSKWNEIERMLDPSIKRIEHKSKSPSKRGKKKTFQKRKTGSIKDKEDSYDKDKKKRSFSKPKRSSSDDSPRSNKFSKRRNSDDSDTDKSSFYKKKKRVGGARFDRDDDKKRSFSKPKRSSSDDSPRSNKFSKRRNSDDSDTDKSSFYKKKKRVGGARFDRDEESSTSFFRKKRVTGKKFGSNEDVKRKPFKKDNMGSKSALKPRFKKKISNRTALSNKSPKKFSREK